jgi:uncharacterized protein (DUF924 family)
MAACANFHREMAQPDEEAVEAVLRFWFGELGPDGKADEEHSARWWRKDAAFDQLVRDRFGALHEAVSAGERDEWLSTPRGRLAFIIVLDQFSRNMFRGSAMTHAGDARAAEVARQGIERGVDRGLAHDERTFFYMPLMHSEELADQDRSVALFTGWRDELEEPARGRVSGMIGYAEKHRDIVRQFGRFPHRNALLGRASTPEELVFLEKPGSSF